MAPVFGRVSNGELQGDSVDVDDALGGNGTQLVGQVHGASDHHSSDEEVSSTRGQRVPALGGGFNNGVDGGLVHDVSFVRWGSHIERVVLATQQT
jgi:hypothetical protein